MMQNNIPKAEVDSLLADVKSRMLYLGLGQETVDGTRILVIHPDSWEVSLLVPYKANKTAELKKAIEIILFDMCGVRKDCCDYLGKQKSKQACEWYFRHPHVPYFISERIEREIELELGKDIPINLPSPRMTKSQSDTAFITMHEEFFNDILQGRKKKEYRTLSQYYCDKFFSSGKPKKYIKINKGYKAGVGNQMVFEISSINLLGLDGRETSAVDQEGNVITTISKLPKDFVPTAYVVILGQRKS